MGPYAASGEGKPFLPCLEQKSGTEEWSPVFVGVHENSVFSLALNPG